MRPHRAQRAVCVRVCVHANDTTSTLPLDSHLHQRWSTDQQRIRRCCRYCYCCWLVSKPGLKHDLQSARGHGLVTCNAIYRTRVRVRTVKTNNHGTAQHSSSTCVCKRLVHLRGKVNTSRAHTMRRVLMRKDYENIYLYVYTTSTQTYSRPNAGMRRYSVRHCTENVIEIIAYCVCLFETYAVL